MFRLESFPHPELRTSKFCDPRCPLANLWLNVDGTFLVWVLLICKRWFFFAGKPKGGCLSAGRLNYGSNNGEPNCDIPQSLNLTGSHPSCHSLFHSSPFTKRIERFNQVLTPFKRFEHGLHRVAWTRQVSFLGFGGLALLWLPPWLATDFGARPEVGVPNWVNPHN